MFEYKIPDRQYRYHTGGFPLLNGQEQGNRSIYHSLILLDFLRQLSNDKMELDRTSSSLPLSNSLC